MSTCWLGHPSPFTPVSLTAVLISSGVPSAQTLRTVRQRPFALRDCRRRRVSHLGLHLSWGGREAGNETQQLRGTGHPASGSLAGTCLCRSFPSAWAHPSWDFSVAESPGPAVFLKRCQRQERKQPPVTQTRSRPEVSGAGTQVTPRRGCGASPVPRLRLRVPSSPVQPTRSGKRLSADAVRLPGNLKHQVRVTRQQDDDPGRSGQGGGGGGRKWREKKRKWEKPRLHQTPRPRSEGAPQVCRPRGSPANPARQGTSVVCLQDGFVRRHLEGPRGHRGRRAALLAHPAVSPL